MIGNTCGGWTCFSLSDEMVEIVFIYFVHVANKLCLFFGEGKNVPINLFNAGELHHCINVLHSLGVMGSITLVNCLKIGIISKTDVMQLVETSCSFAPLGGLFCFKTIRLIEIVC